MITKPATRQKRNSLAARSLFVHRH